MTGDKKKGRAAERNERDYEREPHAQPLVREGCFYQPVFVTVLMGLLAFCHREHAISTPSLNVLESL